MTITFTAPPTLPSLSDPANFNDRALGLFGWLTGTFIPELEGVEGLVPDGGDFNVDSGTFFVDASTNRVGIGTSSPAEPLHVSRLGGTDNALPTFSNLTTILTTPGNTVAASGSGITLHSNVDGSSAVLFSDTDDAGVGAVVYDHSIDELGFRVNGLTRATIDSDGDFAVDTDTLFVDASADRVGIGTTSPSDIIHVVANNPGIRLEDDNPGSEGYHTIRSVSSTLFIQADAGNQSASSNIIFGVDGTEHMRIDSSGRVGIGTTSPSSPLDISGSGDIRAEIESTNSGDVSLDLFRTGANSYRLVNDAGFFRIQNGTTPAGVEDNDRFVIAPTTGRVGINNSSPTEILDVTGNVTISGSLSKGSGSFKIDHPIKPETHHLVHSFIEGPQADNIYRGRVTLVAGGATVNLDMASHMTEGTFAALNGNVQCFTTNEDGWTAIRGKVQGNLLTIEAQDPTCTDEVSWMVIGERHDQHMIDASWTDENGKIIVEPEKPEPVEE